MKRGATAKAHQRIRIRKPLPIYGGEILSPGSEIIVTPDWEPIPEGMHGRIIVDPQGERRLVVEEDLEYALGAH